MNDKILIADDDPDIRQMVSLSLKLGGYAVESVSSGEQTLQKIKEKLNPALIILDLLMPEIGGLETLRRLRKIQPTIPVLVMTCLNTPAMIVEAMQSGAADYVIKPFEDENLHSRVRRLLTRGTPNKRQPSGSVLSLGLPDGQQPFVVRNRQMLKIQETIRQIAHADVPVLIHGETGVGKEVVAKAIHDASDRRDKPFVKINCAALPSTLLESEMFGYERGAFTGAFNSKPGQFELANTGTIFLDEIAEMSPPLQAKFLQVLQDGCFNRLGGKSTIRVNSRVLAATNINLKQALKAGTLREDLYYRLNVVNIFVPPLRERMDEIHALVKFFLEKYGTEYGGCVEMPSARLLTAIRRHDWPGNVRELENVIRRYLVLGDSDLVACELEPSSRENPREAIELSGSGWHGNGAAIPFTKRINDFKQSAETEAISKALGRTNWNRKKAAKLLNSSYKTFLYRMKVLGIGDRVPEKQGARIQ